MSGLLFWSALALLFHTYCGYILSLPVLAALRWRRRPAPSPGRLRVSLLIAAHNEEAVIAEKLRNCEELEYPEADLEVLIGSDGSTDGTHRILRGATGNIKPVCFLAQRGKAAVLNDLAALASGEVLVFSDANTMLLPNAVRRLVEGFGDPRTGCVCGKLLLRDPTGSSLGGGESAYWRFESVVKEMEGRLGIVIGANGGLYALRRELFPSIPVERRVMDDFYITAAVLVAGKGVTFEPLAIGSEETSADPAGEFHRKIRIGEANFNFLKSYLRLLDPRLGLAAYGFFSHKFLRWFSPFLLMLALLSNLPLAIGQGLRSPYGAFFALQTAFYLAAVAGWLAARKSLPSPFFFSFPFYFVSMNAALRGGMVKSIFGSSGGAWERIERARSLA